MLAEIRRLRGTKSGSSESAPRSTSPSYPPDRDSLFRLLTENSRDVITRHAADSTLLYVSPAVHSFLGYAPEDLLGRSAMELVSEDDVDLLRAAVVEALKHGKDDFSVEHKMRRIDHRNTR